MKTFTFRKGGIHPPENKLSAGAPIREAGVPEKLTLLLGQSIGAPSKPVVKQGDKVTRGMLIAEPGGFVSAALHSPVNGVVEKIIAVRNAQGLWQESIIIAADKENALEEKFSPRSQEEIEKLSGAEIIDIVAKSGIVGLGGATFPTQVKLKVPEGKRADYVLINGAECEPYLTCDDALMKASPEQILLGALCISRACGAKKIIVGIEENKPEAIKKLREAARKYPAIEIAALKKKYPQGSEKQLIYALTRSVVPTGGLPIDCHCIVDNVATAYAIYEAVYLRKPLMERIVTVTGKEMANPCNLKVLLGTDMSLLLNEGGGLPENTGKVLAGGPMMGKACSTIEAPSTKGLSGIVAMSVAESERKEAQPCIRCSACIYACPMGLEPYLFMQQSENRYWDDMKAHGVLNCIECGCCSYSCPASRPLLDMIRLGKIEIRKNK